MWCVAKVAVCYIIRVLALGEKRYDVLDINVVWHTLQFYAGMEYKVTGFRQATAETDACDLLPLQGLVCCDCHVFGRVYKLDAARRFVPNHLEYGGQG